MAERECQLQELTESLSECQQVKDKGCKIIQYMMIRIKSLEIDLNRLKGEQANTTEGVLEEVGVFLVYNHIHFLTHIILAGFKIYNQFLPSRNPFTSFFCMFFIKYCKQINMFE